ncbi:MULTISPECIES: hypothetical protein [unclassified Mesorhizobium]|uniref:hypothetical protein n=1 Tax=unclassified Mesorhizobium TaxID=325217 RepID=UPI00333B447B
MTKTNQRASARPHNRASAREMLATAHQHMAPADIAEHALKLAGELEALARMLTSQNGIVTAVAGTLRNQSMTVRSINAMYRTGRKREAREALAAAAAVPNLESMPLAVFSPEWATALFSPADAREARH